MSTHHDTTMQPITFAAEGSTFRATFSLSISLAREPSVSSCIHPLSLSLSVPRSSHTPGHTRSQTPALAQTWSQTPARALHGIKLQYIGGVKLLDTQTKSQTPSTPRSQTPLRARKLLATHTMRQIPSAYTELWISPRPTRTIPNFTAHNKDNSKCRAPKARDLTPRVPFGVSQEPQPCGPISCP